MNLSQMSKGPHLRALALSLPQTVSSNSSHCSRVLLIVQSRLTGSLLSKKPHPTHHHLILYHNTLLISFPADPLWLIYFIINSNNHHHWSRGLLQTDTRCALAVFSFTKSRPALRDPQTVAHQTYRPFTLSWSLLKLMSIELVVSSNHLILCHSLLLLPSIFPSIRVSPNKSTLGISAAMYWSFSLFNEYSGLISIRINWFDLLAVQGTLKNLLQHHNSKAPILQCSAFFMVQLTSVPDYWKNDSFDYTDLCW